MLAGQHPRRQCEEQRPQPGRTDHPAMNLHRWLTVLFVLLALAGCAQTATGQGHTPAPSYPSDNAPDRRGDMM
jgi:hypothetical protein